MQVHLLVHPLRHRMPIRVMLKQCQGNDRWQQPLAIVLDEAQELLLVLAGDVVFQEAHRRKERGPSCVRSQGTPQVLDHFLHGFAGL